MTVLLRAVLVVAAALGLLVCVVALPEMGKVIAAAAPEFAWALRPCLIWSWAFALPIFAAMVPCWRIFGSISAPGGPFTRANVRSLRWIAGLALLDALVFPAGMLILGHMGAGQPFLTVVVTPVVMFSCAAVGLGAWVLSHLVSGAVELREENELTI
jgi:hypothetical protein